MGERPRLSLFQAEGRGDPSPPFTRPWGDDIQGPTQAHPRTGKRQRPLKPRRLSRSLRMNAALCRESFRDRCFRGSAAEGAKGGALASSGRFFAGIRRIAGCVGM